MSATLSIAIVVTLALTLLAAPPAAEGQPLSPTAPRLGVLSGSFPDNDACLEAFRSGLRDLGYREGTTHLLEVRWAEGRIEAFPRLAAELVRGGSGLA